MAMVGKVLMDKFYTLNREAMDEDKFSASFVYNLAENRVNNLMHGRYPAEWLPIFLKQMKEEQEETDNSEEKDAYARIIAVTEEVITEL
jgi:hypothetical protein